VPDIYVGAQEGWCDLGILEKCLEKKVFEIDFDEVWVFRQEGILRAISNICPHKMGPISEGIFEDGAIECPWHGFRFDVDSGVSVKERCPSLRIYQTKIEKGHMFIKEVKM